ncbi:MAG: hypothetical protein ACAI38_10730 [Myxococcota bacterium]
MSTVSQLARNERPRSLEEVEAQERARQSGASSSSAAPATTGTVRLSGVEPTTDRVERPVTALAAATTTSTHISSEAARWNAHTAAAANSFAANTDAALNGSRSLSSEDLSAAFMRLNVLDPTDSVATQMSLISAQAELARLAIQQARAAMQTAQRDRAKSAGRDLLAKSLLAVDPGLVKVQETLVKKGWMSEKYVAFHIKLARDQEAQAKGDAAAGKEASAAAQAQLDAGIAMLKDCTKRMQALLARQAEDARNDNRMDGASIDGVPMPRLQAAVSQAMGRIYAQLGAVQAQEGALGVLTNVEDIARAEFSRALEAAGMHDSDGLTDFLVANVVLDVSSAYLDGETGIATGRALAEVAHAHGANTGGSSGFAGAGGDIAALSSDEAGELLERHLTNISV